MTKETFLEQFRNINTFYKKTLLQPSFLILVVLEQFLKCSFNFVHDCYFFETLDISINKTLFNFEILYVKFKYQWNFYDIHCMCFVQIYNGWFLGVLWFKSLKLNKLWHIDIIHINEDINFDLVNYFEEKIRTSFFIFCWATRWWKLKNLTVAMRWLLYYLQQCRRKANTPEKPSISTKVSLLESDSTV